MIDVERKTGSQSPDYSREGEAAVNRGVDYDIPAPSGLAAARNWRLGDGTLTTGANMTPQDGGLENTRPQPQSSIDLAAVDVDLASRNLVRGLFDGIRVAVNGDNGQPVLDVASVLNGSLLVADENAILEYGDEFSDGALADYFLQLSVSDTISPSGALATRISSPADASALTESRLQDFRFELVYGVMSRYTDIRKPKFEPSRSVGYMHDMIGLANGPETVSEEYLLQLSSTYRIKSADWKEKISIDSQFVNFELALMEAELLHLKHRRWQVRRDINILLSQLLAAELRDEFVN